MKVLFYEPFAINTPHFERCLELMNVHLEQGDEVTFLGCERSLTACDVNMGNNAFTCKTCISRKNRGLALLNTNLRIDTLTNLQEADQREIEKIKQKEFSSVQELQALYYENFDLGFAVASSLISYTRNARPDLKKNKKLLSELLGSALTVYFSIGNYLKEIQPERLYFFNGRFAILRAALRAAEAQAVDFYIHEVSFTIDKYCLYKNVLPHNIAARSARIKELWEAADPATREAIGASFYHDQSTGNVADPKYHHTKAQAKGRLPEDWDPAKNNIAIFNSSEDEFASIGDEWKLPFYTSQLDGIKRIATSLAANPDKDHFYLRIHPNMKKISGELMAELAELNLPNFTVIPPDSPVDTYGLVASSDKIVTFMSSVGIEAAFRGKPVILLGSNFYRELGSTYNPESHEEVIALLQQTTLPAKDNTGALIYGYYRKMDGISYRFYEPETLFKGKFMGEEINPPVLAQQLGTLFKKIDKLKTSLK